MKLGDPSKRKGKTYARTIESLRLNIPEAVAGRTWLLLPENFRAQEFGLTYPLPTNINELQRLATLPIPPNKEDSGCKYLQRAVKEWKSRIRRRQSAVFDYSRKASQISSLQNAVKSELKALRETARQEVEGVRESAQKAIAGLNDLFDLGRKGLDEQMRAHLEGREWQGERITSAAFRECFRMVSQAVKGLGLPSDQRTPATQAILEQVAESIKETQDAMSLAPGVPEETPQ